MEFISNHTQTEHKPNELCNFHAVRDVIVCRFVFISNSFAFFSNAWSSVQLLFAVNWVEKWSITKYEREKKEQLESGEENKNQMVIECPISWHPKKRLKKVRTTDKEWQTHTLAHSHTSSYKMSETFVRLWHHWNKWLELKWMSFARCVFFRRNEGMKEQCASTHTNIPCYEYFKGKARVNADEKGEPNETLCVLSHNHHHRTTPHYTTAYSDFIHPLVRPTSPFRFIRIRAMWSARGAHIQLFSEIH